MIEADAKVAEMSDKAKIVWQCSNCCYSGYPQKNIYCPTCGGLLNPSMNNFLPSFYKIYIMENIT